MALRETGSIVVHAPRDRVFEVVRQRMAEEPGLRTINDDRIESAGSTFVLRDAPGGTRVVHARILEPTFLIRPGAELKQAVTEELLMIQKLASMDN